MPTPPKQIDAHSWSWFARNAGLGADEKLLLALSGGADSVYLLHILAAARPRPALCVLHVQHGLRGSESEADEHFCRQLCGELELPFHCAKVQLDEAGASLENQARRARYRELRRSAEATGHHTILTAHQAQDVLETLMWRWIRGSAPAGLRGPRLRSKLPAGASSIDLELVRPLLDLSRDELRKQLSSAGLSWREDSSNLDERFTRNRLRQSFMPLLERLGGAGWQADLSGYAQGIEAAEERAEKAMDHLFWSRTQAGTASLPRTPLAQLAPTLLRRALWRLLTEATGKGPRAALLELVIEDLARGKNSTHSLDARWMLHLEADFLRLDARKPPELR
jgi:tRNA(Ile)-lysidine synthetase-like protein